MDIQNQKAELQAIGLLALGFAAIFSLKATLNTHCPSCSDFLNSAFTTSSSSQNFIDSNNPNAINPNDPVVYQKIIERTYDGYPTMDA